MTTILCPHGNPVDGIEVTTYSDPRPVYVAGLCDCPRPHCPLCGIELVPAMQGRCWGDIECALHGRLVPEPDVH